MKVMTDLEMRENVENALSELKVNLEKCDSAAGQQKIISLYTLRAIYGQTIEIQRLTAILAGSLEGTVAERTERSKNEKKIRGRKRNIIGEKK